MSKIYFGTNIKTKGGNMVDSFRDNLNLTHVYQMPKGLINISNIFRGCRKLKYVDYELEDSLEDISNAFRMCSKFDYNKNIPTTISNASYSFAMSGIKNVQFKTNNTENTNEKHWDVSFSRCNNLKTIVGNLPSGNVNAYCMFEDNPNLYSCEGNIDVINSNRMFNNCINLKNVYNINTVDAYLMFKNCTNLTNVGNFSSCIIERSFINCKNIVGVNIYGETLINVFDSCDNLSTVNIKGKFYYEPDKNKVLHIENIISNCNNIKSLSIDYNECNDNLVIDQDFTSLDKNSVVFINGTIHNIDTEINIREQLNDATKAYYQSGYFTKDYFSNGLDYYNFQSYIGESNYVYLDNRIRSNPFDSSTEREINYLDGCFSGSQINKVMTKRSSLSLGNNMFNGSSIQNFYAPSLTIPIANDFFAEAKMLKDIKFKQSENIISQNFFKNCFELSNIRDEYDNIYSIYSIADYGFYECQKIVDDSILLKGGTIGNYGLYNTSIMDLDVKNYAPSDTKAIYALASINGRNSIKIQGLKFLNSCDTKNINHFYINGSASYTISLENRIFQNLYLSNIYDFFSNCFRNCHVNEFSVIDTKQTMKYSMDMFNGFSVNYVNPNTAKYFINSSYYDDNYHVVVWNTSATYVNKKYNVFNAIGGSNSRFCITISDANCIFTGNGYSIETQGRTDIATWNAPNLSNRSSSSTIHHSVFPTQTDVSVSRYIPGRNLYCLAENLNFERNSMYLTSNFSNYIPINVYGKNGTFNNYPFGCLDQEGDAYGYGYIYYAKVYMNHATEKTNGGATYWTADTSYGKKTKRYRSIESLVNTTYEKNVYNAMPVFLRDACDVYNEYGNIVPSKLNQL